MVSLRRSLLIATSLLLMVFVAACGTSSPSSQSSSTSATAKQSAQQAAGQATGADNVQSNNQINGQDKAQASNQNASGQMSGQNANGQTSSQNAKGQASGQNAKSQASGQGQGTYQANTQTNGGASTGNTNTFVRTTQTNLNGNNVLVLVSGTGMTLYYRTTDPAPASTCTAACAQTWPPLTGSGTLISSQALPASLTFHMTANGNQVEYNGHPLYTYTGDTTPGQINGQGVGNEWVAVTITNGPQMKQHW